MMSGLGEFYDVIYGSASVQEQFSLMLLERIEKIETHSHYLEGELERTQNKGHIEAARFKRCMLRWIILDYRNYFEQYTISDGLYWMRMLLDSLEGWREDRPYPRVPEAEALAYMRGLTRNVTPENADIAHRVAEHFMSMTLDDIEAFTMWDELPDLA